MTLAGVLGERHRNRVKALAALPAANAQAVAETPEAEPRQPASGVQLTGLTELPPPSGAAMIAGGPWQPFVDFALNQAPTLTEDTAVSSALLTRESVLTFGTAKRPCEAREPAVVIDLDVGKTPFAPDLAQGAPSAAAAAAAQLRAAGVIVLWVSQASANDVAGIADALQASGLDPTGRDPILLVRNEEERKQVLREEANDSVCVLAIAGDERSDFDELFDYLRDTRLQTAYDAQLGAGWFLVPPLFASGMAGPAAVTEAPAEAGR